MSAKTRVCVIGAGPIGLELALALSPSCDVEVVERGASAGAGVTSWAHVRLFSPWSLNASAEGWEAAGVSPDDIPAPEDRPTGGELVALYLQPLAAALKARHGVRFRWETEAVSVARSGVSKGAGVGDKDKARSRWPFAVLLRNLSGEEEFAVYDAICDCSGSYSAVNANSLGPGGAPALGEASIAGHPGLYRVVPDVLGKDASRFGPDKVTAVVGAGYSAAATLEALASLAPDRRGKVQWITRKPAGEAPYARVPNDPLPARDALVALCNGLSSGDPDFAAVSYTPATQVVVVSVRNTDEGRILVGLAAVGETTAERYVEVDNLVSCCGYHPSTSLQRELQVHTCYATDGPMALAAALMAAGGGGGDCMSQAAPGAATLKTTEPNFHIVGSKSYGRSSAFLLRVGREQVAHVAALLTGSA